MKEPGGFQLILCGQQAQSALRWDPDLGAIEGVGGTQAQALVGGGKHTQTMVVGVPKAINSNGLKVDAILGDVQVKATLCPSADSSAA